MLIAPPVVKTGVMHAPAKRKISHGVATLVVVVVFGFGFLVVVGWGCSVGGGREEDAVDFRSFNWRFLLLISVIG